MLPVLTPVKTGPRKAEPVAQLLNSNKEKNKIKFLNIINF